MITSENERLLRVLREREVELDKLRVYSGKFSDMDKKLMLITSENERLLRVLREREVELDKLRVYSVKFSDMD